MPHARTPHERADREPRGIMRKRFWFFDVMPSPTEAVLFMV
jgi:hypothetical protein